MILPESAYSISVPGKLNPTTIAAFSHALADFKTTEKAVLVLQADRSEIFCNGMDLQWLANSQNTFGKERSTWILFAEILQSIMNSDAITLAIVDGEVTGGGVGIMAACDFVLASANSTFQLSEGLLGFYPALIMPALKSRISDRVIKRMVFTGERYTAEQAQSVGLIDEFATKQEFTDLTQKWISQLSRCEPEVIRGMDYLLDQTHSYSQTYIEDSINLLEQALKKPRTQKRIAAISYMMGEE